MSKGRPLPNTAQATIDSFPAVFRTGFPTVLAQRVIEPVACLHAIAAAVRYTHTSVGREQVTRGDVPARFRERATRCTRDQLPR